VFTLVVTPQAGHRGIRINTKRSQRIFTGSVASKHFYRLSSLKTFLFTSSENQSKTVCKPMKQYQKKRK
jgi:hypothetical protein